MLFQAERSLSKTLVAVKENITFQPMYYNDTVLHSCKLCTKLYCNIEKGKFWSSWCLWIVTVVI